MAGRLLSRRGRSGCLEEEATAFTGGWTSDATVDVEGRGTDPGSGEGVGSCLGGWSTVNEVAFPFPLSLFVPSSFRGSTTHLIPSISSTPKRFPLRWPKPTRTSSSARSSPERSIPSSQSSMLPCRVPPGVLGGKARQSV